MNRMVVMAMLAASVGLTSSVALAAAQATVGPGLVYGEVTQKFTPNGGNADNFLIAVRGVPYEVPMAFWYQVQVGNTVRYTGTAWQIVKTAFGPEPQHESDRVTFESAPAPVGGVAGPGTRRQPYWMRQRLENMGR